MMCGIFGIYAKKDTQYSPGFLAHLVAQIARISESRGKESSGIAIRDPVSREIRVLRSAMSVSDMLKTPEYRTNISERIKNAHYPLAVMGHSRLVTNGSHLDAHNNQPVVKNGVVGVHNGIIVNVDELWSAHGSMEREYEVDTEALLFMVSENMRSGSTSASVSQAVGEVFGTVSSAMLFHDRSEAVLVTNNGSLYILTDGAGLLVFASERHMLEVLKKKHIPRRFHRDMDIRQIEANNGLVICLEELALKPFVIGGDAGRSMPVEPYAVLVEDIPCSRKQHHSVIDADAVGCRPEAERERKLLQDNRKAIMGMKRCTKCLLPESFPFIEFHRDGVCNYCRNYVKKNIPRPPSELEKLVEPYRRKNELDVIVPYSGGRDSTFVLHYMKTVLNMNPIAYTYDWGMVTDLARRNIARVCGRLGVENIIVSADIGSKRQNIRKNIMAWTRRPNLATVPLFMAGDKYFFHHCNILKKQIGVTLNVWGTNNLENTDFKSGFLGLKPEFGKDYIYSLSRTNQAKLFFVVLENTMLNPRYINSSVFDTLGSYVVRYISPKKDYFHFYDYYRWDEREIVDTITRLYDWETAKDTRVTWRIGDGTASFYNYIYHTVAGFTESDTFRSNQIREGMITREAAMQMVELENLPRYESIKWYMEILDLDFEDVISVINNMPKLYRTGR